MSRTIAVFLGLIVFCVCGCTTTTPDAPDDPKVVEPQNVEIESNADDGIVVAPEKIQDAQQDENAPVLPAYTPWWK